MASSKLFCAVVVGSISLIACSKQGTSQEPESAYTASNEATAHQAALAPDPAGAEPSTADPALEPGPIGATGPVASTAAVSPPAPLTDGQILKVAEAVDKGEIDQSKEVQKKARNPQVKKLAAELIAHHTQSKQKAQTLGKKAQLTPEDSTVSTELSAKAEEHLQTIKTASDAKGAEQAYVDGQIRQHEAVLELLNTRLIPSAINADLKAQLEETRKMIETHIEDARRVKQAIGDTAVPPPPAT